VIVHITIRDDAGQPLAHVGYGKYGNPAERIFCTEPGTGKFWTQYGDQWKIPVGGTIDIIGS
jgi:hypothetical protein